MKGIVFDPEWMEKNKTRVCVVSTKHGTCPVRCNNYIIIIVRCFDKILWYLIIVDFKGYYSKNKVNKKNIITISFKSQIT